LRAAEYLSTFVLSYEPQDYESGGLTSQVMQAAQKPTGLLALAERAAILITNVIRGKLKIAHREAYPDGA